MVYGVSNMVEIDFLRHDADAGLGGLELPIDVVAEHVGRAGALVDERGDDADERRLAGAVGSEQREEIALLDIEIDAFERLDTVLVGLGETANRQCIHGREDRMSRARAQERFDEARAEEELSGFHRHRLA